jgi:hypothetical protein
MQMTREARLEDIHMQATEGERGDLTAVAR